MSGTLNLEQLTDSILNLSGIVNEDFSPQFDTNQLNVVSGIVNQLSIQFGKLSQSIQQTVNSLKQIGGTGVVLSGISTGLGFGASSFIGGIGAGITENEGIRGGLSILSTSINPFRFQEAFLNPVGFSYSTGQILRQARDEERAAFRQGTVSGSTSRSSV